MRQINFNDCSVTYLVHQTSCTAKRPAYVSKVIFDRFPNANVYMYDGEKKPGDIIVTDNDSNWEYMKMINLFGQYHHGKSTNTETSEMRLAWFRHGLDKIYELLQNEICSIGFVKYMGCGSAGGDWDVYYKEIANLEKKMENVDFYLVNMNVKNKLSQ